jgi:transposase
MNQCRRTCRITIFPEGPLGVDDRDVRHDKVDDRRVISGIVHVLLSGGRWIDAHACYAPKKTF